MRARSAARVMNSLRKLATHAKFEGLALPSRYRRTSVVLPSRYRRVTKQFLGDFLPQPASAPMKPTTLFRRIDKGILAVNRALMIAALAVMATIVLANVLTRYLTHYSIPWSEELARYLMIWLTFLGIGPVLRLGGHVAIDTLQDSLRSSMARVVRLLIVAAVAVFCAVVAYFGSAYVGRTWMQATAVMEIPFALVAAAVPTGMLLALWHLAVVARGFVLDRHFDESTDLNPEEAAAV